MHMQSNYTHHRKDHASDELVVALLAKPTYVFNELYQVVEASLHAQKRSRVGEEMLRLRVYEKLQALVSRGLVRKTDKKYSAVRTALQAYAAEIARSQAADHLRRGALLAVE